MNDASKTEIVELKVVLDSVWYNEPPKYEVLLNEETISYGTVEEKESNNQEKVLTFKKELAEGNHTLKIRLLGKTSKHTRVDENKNIIEDQILNIKQIEIDEVELDHLFYQLGKYHKQINFVNKDPEYDLEALPDSYKNLGWNGEWRLHFSVPTYMWFLENL
jgi:hypothetical protein